MQTSIKEFASQRGVDKHSVTVFIKRHPELDVAFPVVAGERTLDTEVEEFSILDKQYPVPKPVVYEDTPETKAELLALRLENVKLRETLDKSQARVERQQVAIADYQEEHARYMALVDAQSAMQEKLDSAEQRAADAEKAADQMRKAGFWTRIRGFK